MTLPTGMRILKLVVALAVFALPGRAMADWQNLVSPADLDRLNRFYEIRDAAWNGAQQGEGLGDRRALARVMQSEGKTVPASVLAGAWRCRQMKLGGISAYIVYDRWFRCSIRAVPGGFALSKTDGSQLFSGFLYPQDGAWIYVGASRVRGEPAHRYSGPPPSLGAPATPDDQIGLLTGIGDDRLRLEIPAVQESLLDVVEFTR